jgi:dCMP deaminase
MKPKFVQAFMKTAETFAELSHARRLRVGAIIVKDDRIISIGYNGMPSGWTNECEYEDVIWVDGTPLMDVPGNREWVTKDEVLHAEANAITKLAKSNESGADSTIFITHAPCIHCAKLICQSGITRVFYRNSYRDESGLSFLNKSGIAIHQV